MIITGNPGDVTSPKDKKTGKRTHRNSARKKRERTILPEEKEKKARGNSAVGDDPQGWKRPRKKPGPREVREHKEKKKGVRRHERGRKRRD